MQFAPLSFNTGSLSRARIAPTYDPFKAAVIFYQQYSCLSTEKTKNMERFSGKNTAGKKDRLSFRPFSVERGV